MLLLKVIGVFVAARTSSVSSASNPPVFSPGPYYRYESKPSAVSYLLIYIMLDISENMGKFVVIYYPMHYKLVLLLRKNKQINVFCF